MSIDRRYILLFAATGLLTLAAGCTRHVSRGITPEGTAAEVIFPTIDRIVLEEGTFPNVDSLRTVGAGVTKDQLYELLGRPHFREGYHGVREWDYLFHFRMPGNGILTCQYKVIFDSEYRGRSFHWSPAGCADEVLGQVERPAAEPIRFELSGDALFRFDGGAVADMLPDGRDQVIAIAEELKQAGATSVQVIGHTDRLGSESYNQGLSQRRAVSVRQLLIEHGISAATITAVGAGESQPVTRCGDGLEHGALVACLQPDRRVEIVATGTRR